MLFWQLIDKGLAENPTGIALRCDGASLTYEDLGTDVERVAAGMAALGVLPGERVAVWLPKSFETVTAFFAASRCGAVFVPVNPVLRPAQVQHILSDSGARCLVTTADRLGLLAPEAAPEIIILTDAPEQREGCHSWQSAISHGGPVPDAGDDAGALAALLYTSGSTGQPKGVMLSHRNLTLGAQSVASYLGNEPDDRILCVLPLSFDYGLSQITTAFYAGATAVLINHLFAGDVINAIDGEGITGLACVPPLWHQLLAADWPEGTGGSLRYLTNSGGHLPAPAVEALRHRLPRANLYLMYGLTEAFRSTYLDPHELDNRPGSMGKAIPFARIDVVNGSGQPAAPGEHGELVHSGSLVALGYWNDPARTVERFRPLPDGFGVEEPSVWSGDTVYADDDGFLYFVERRDAMIKTSGYRVSPTEVEDVIYQADGISEAVAVGVPHPELGQAVVAVIVPEDHDTFETDNILSGCRQILPGFMVPRIVVVREELPRNPNGKIDRKALADQLGGLFQGEARK